VCDSANFERKQEEYMYMKQLELLHIPTPKLIHFIKLEGLNKCVQVFEWTQGVNGEESLSKLSVEEQYNAGRKAGEVLKRIHSIERESASNKWEIFRWNKYERYIEALADYEVNFLDLKPVLTFVENHKDLLKNRPITFLHDDFHPANSMIHNKEFIIIDFGGYDFGDPIHDFYYKNKQTICGWTSSRLLRRRSVTPFLETVFIICSDDIPSGYRMDKPNYTTFSRGYERKIEPNYRRS
jgi:aminoglycoside phosphotransferase (APT) family kinase protein